MRLEAFSPPGNLTDLSPKQQAGWSDTVSGHFAEAIGGIRDDASQEVQFFDPTETDIAADVRERAIFWFAFPRTIKVQAVSDRQRWEQADADRGVQDEYCEWSVTRNEQNKVVRVTFTSETPEYWKALAGDKQTLLALYREFVDAGVQPQDLVDAAGHYDPHNAWNTRTDGPIAHLIQGSNNLDAAIVLAAAATVVREIDGRQLTSEQELIACSKYGEPKRNSDPHIGAQVNELARARADVTLADPAGLYINNLATVGWSTPDGTDPQSFWRPVRGAPGHCVRADYEVPADKGYTVGDVTIAGHPIEFGGQIADSVSIRLTGAACRFGTSNVPPRTTCA